MPKTFEAFTKNFKPRVCQEAPSKYGDNTSQAEALSFAVQSLETSNIVSSDSGLANRGRFDREAHTTSTHRARSESPGLNLVSQVDIGQ